MLLAIDSSAGASTAVIRRGEVAAGWRTEATTTHAEVLAEAVQGVLRHAHSDPHGPPSGTLEAVVVGVGPGPFTGLRVGLALAHSLAEVWQVPLVGVCSLDSIAHRAVQHGVLTEPEGPFLVATDARRREIYCAVYQHGPTGRPTGGEPFVTAPAEAPNLPTLGIGASLYPDDLEPPSPTTPEAAHQPDVAGWLPDAVELGLIAEQELAAHPEIVQRGAEGPDAGQWNAETAWYAETMLRPPLPLYLRESDAKIPAQMQSTQEPSPQRKRQPKATGGPG